MGTWPSPRSDERLRIVRGPWHAERVDAPRRFGNVLVIGGPESIVADREAASFVEQARLEHPDATLARVEAATLDAGSLAELTGGSLFADRQVVIIEGIDALDPELFDAVLELAKDPPDELALALVHPGGQRGKGLLDKLKKTKATFVEAAAIKPWAVPQFAIAEARRWGGRLDQETASALAEALGSDVRAVAGAVKQLLDDSEDGTISPDVVKRYFAGRADVTSFTVADAVMAGQRDAALGALRWALDTGVAPVLVSSALAAALRSLGKYQDARDARVRDQDMARVIGVPPFKVKDLARQSREWTSAGLARSIQVVARADAGIKGAATDPGFALEQMVIQVTAERGRRAERPTD